MNSSQKDLQLIEQIKNDNTEALEKLFGKYYVSLCRFTIHFLPNKAVVEETVSDVFIQIWDKRKNLSIKGNVKAYLFKATKNKALNNLKKENKPLTDLEGIDVKTSSHTPIETLMFQELNEGLGTIIDLLPNRRKTIFQLSRFEGFTYAEIANILSISVKTVENQMGEALKQLKKLYDSHQL